MLIVTCYKPTIVLSRMSGAIDIGLRTISLSVATEAIGYHPGRVG